MNDFQFRDYAVIGRAVLRDGSRWSVVQVARSLDSGAITHIEAEHEGVRGAVFPIECVATLEPMDIIDGNQVTL